MSKKVICFLPCRKGSQRIPSKNIKKFNEFSFGLVEIKLKQLITAKLIDEVVLSTNDEDILKFANTIKSNKLKVHHRIDELASSKTSTDKLVAHALELIPNAHILWTHVTSPFINSARYDEIIKSYFDAIDQGFDSLMTTTELYGFLWQNGKSMNYDRSVEKWPPTQSLEPVQEVNSGVFLASDEIYRELDDRIGNKPFLHPLDKLTAHDIDWPEDFALADCMVREGLVKL